MNHFLTSNFLLLKGKHPASPNTNLNKFEESRKLPCHTLGSASYASEIGKSVIYFMKIILYISLSLYFQF